MQASAPDTPSVPRDGSALAAPTIHRGASLFRAPLPASDSFVRRLHPDERDLVRQHLERLDPVSRRLRFGNCVNDAFIERYAGTSLDPGGVVLALFVEGVVRGVAELHFTSRSGDEAEVAFSIEPDHQGLGHGTHLFGRILDAARNRGVRRLWLTCLAENRRILAIARKFGARVTVIGDEATAEFADQHPGPGSLSREFAEEGAASVLAMIERRQRRFARLLRPFRRAAAPTATQSPN
ncbi:MAG: GNAT family N-acetyltransferase [Fulvimarina sp.]|nr:GNAT family N-acetyltransferase [Fulvimarina sp.]